MTLAQLLQNPPPLHVFKASKATPAGLHEPGELINRWKLADEELRFIASRVGPRSRTIETGAGCSTVLFALLGSQHTVVVPDAKLAERICAWCSRHDISIANMRFIIGPSERVLPGLSGELSCNFDLALIDGQHGFPQPFLDWSYLAPLLAPGGVVVSDDLHVWTSEVLFSYLQADSDWQLVHESLSGCAFLKLGKVQNDDYENQPYVWQRSRQQSAIAKGRYLAGLVARKNWSLLGFTLKLAVQSLLAGNFGYRPEGKR